MPLDSDGMASPFPLARVGNLGATNLAASQSQVALKFNTNDATTGSENITGEPMPQGGWIVGVTAVLTNNKTAGVFGISPTINGSEPASTDALYRVPIANSAKICTAKNDAGGSARRFNAGDLIGAKVTTDGSFAAGATPDLHVVVWVVFDNWQM